MCNVCVIECPQYSGRTWWKWLVRTLGSCVCVCVCDRMSSLGSGRTWWKWLVRTPGSCVCVCNWMSSLCSGRTWWRWLVRTPGRWLTSGTSQSGNAPGHTNTRSPTILWWVPDTTVPRRRSTTPNGVFYYTMVPWRVFYYIKYGILLHYGAVEGVLLYQIEYFTTLWYRGRCSTIPNRVFCYTTVPWRVFYYYTK